MEAPISCEKEVSKCWLLRDIWIIVKIENVKVCSRKVESLFDEFATLLNKLEIVEREVLVMNLLRNFEIETE